MFSLLGLDDGFSVETLGLRRPFLPLMSAMGYDRLVTASTIIPRRAGRVMAATVNPFSIGVAAGEASVSLGACGGACCCGRADGDAWLGAALRRQGAPRPVGLAGRRGRSRRWRSGCRRAGPDGQRLTGTQKAVLGITAFAFGLMIFSVIPGQRDLGPRRPGR